jgi:hypothetical protein
MVDDLKKAATTKTYYDFIPGFIQIDLDVEQGTV